MPKKLQKSKYFSLVTIILLCAVLIFVCTLLFNLKSGVKISYLDVGQGDATLITVLNGPNILIDTGPGNTVLRALDKEFMFFPRRLDIILLTHLDADHIGGTVEILRRYDVGVILITHNSDKPEIADIKILAQEKNIPIKIVKQGDYLDLGNNSALQILFPDQSVDDWEENTTSAIIRLAVGEESFIFTGDAPQATENLVAYYYGSALKANVLKLGHHGSKTSTSDMFLAAVNPEYTVISAGLNNRYGHPNKETIEKINKLNKKILETFQSRTIEFWSDGKTLSMSI
ncbi:MAG: ComEC/Rec2 family competence protein [Minisyncoccia bacterium]